VASRISQIQSLGNPTLASTFVQIECQRHENSCSGFGQRVNSRFGQPASRNTGTMEQTQVDSTHLFLGPTLSRKNHGEEHALTAKHRVSFDRTPGIHGQLKPQGFVKHVKHDTAVLWSALKHPPAAKSARKSRSESSIGPLRKLSPDKVRRSLEATDNSSRSRARVREDENSGSDSSMTTTSDVRRQDVRDLYREYGVERPRRLVSSRGSSRDIDQTPKPSKQQYQRCYACSSTNVLFSSRCAGCGNDLREGHGVSTTLAETAQPGRSTGAMAERENGEYNPLKPSSAPKGLNRKPVATTHTATLQRPRPSVFQPPKPGHKPVQKKSPDTIKLPLVVAGIVTANFASNPLSKRASVPRRLTPPILPPSRAQMRLTVKQSPFLLADTKASGYLSRPTESVVRQPLAPSELHHSQQHINGKCNCTDASIATDDVCQSPSCRAAYNGHKPSRHTLTCSQRKRHIDEVTDPGYIADVSHGDDGQEAIQKARFQLPSPNGSENHSGTGGVHESESTYDLFLVEHIKCYNYPQTTTRNPLATKPYEALDDYCCWSGECRSQKGAKRFQA
jgi:hypothetical protein